MDAFLEPFWNLDQIRGWAETRDPEIIRAAGLLRYGQPKKTLEIAIRTTHMATAILRDGRDIDGELWAASGWAPKVKPFDPPPMVQDYAEKQGRPAYLAYRYKDLQVHWPVNPKARALARAWMFASERNRELAVEITVDHYAELRGALDDERLKKLPPSFAHLLRDAISGPAVQGPPHVYIREPFRTVDYIEYLFRSGRLEAAGNRPNNPEAIKITPVDWGGLQIAVGGDNQRLGVWIRGQVSIIGYGAFENVRVKRDEVLHEFPAEAPGAVDPQPGPATDDEICDVIKAASEMNGGFIAQNAGTELVQQYFPEVSRERARQLVKRVTRSDKPGPKGPRLRKGA